MKPGVGLGEVADPEQRALARTRWSISLRVAAVMTAVVVFIGAVVFGVLLLAQRGDAEREVRWAVTHGEAGNPPGCVWLLVRHEGEITGTPNPPPGFPRTTVLDQVAADGQAVLERLHRNNTDYTVLTQRRGSDVVQAVYDERFQIAARASLLLALAVAELVALVAAGIAGFVLARRAIAPLGDVLRRQRRFIADASHELRTPLTQLHTRAQLLARRVDGAAAAPQLATELQRLVAGTRQLNDVVDDLLLSAQLGAAPQEFTTVDLMALAGEVVASEDARAQTIGLTITLRRGPGRHLVAGVPSALRRVISALVDNAIAHTPPGGEIVITVDLPSPDAVRLSVRDNGVGFDPADAERIFERFARGSTGRGRRFGLGLALVREVVQGHQGRIMARGQLGTGAEFTVLLPADRRAPTIPTRREPEAVRLPASPVPTAPPAPRTPRQRAARRG
ncbi:sensor histidine kinase [Goodfellowiella coeruleoviolacea]|uniref:sensor histidine kinase n=1 Tax=Goodfellowiella coeruleoviolacea TaxID=334858 RepID=UPI0020A46FFC|nr:HAMP domain-containing sensor histidine kinase [Goodfellowiella coeruleoviolacea]